MTTSEYVLAVDPGKTTGYILWEKKSGSIISFGELDFEKFCLAAEGIITAYRRQLQVVAEAFIITMQTAKNTQAPWSLEVIGVLRFVCHKTGADFKTRSAADAKRFSSDDKLARVGWYTRGRRHQNDAARHLMLELVERGDVSPARLVT